MRGKAFTTMQEAIMKDMFHRGASIKDIAKRIGRTESSVRTKLNSFGLFASKRDAKHENPTKPVTVVEPMRAAAPVMAVVEKKTLNDFTPREMIKNLYERGYRIINGKLYQITKVEVKIADIIA